MDCSAYKPETDLPAKSSSKSIVENYCKAIEAAAKRYKQQLVEVQEFNDQDQNPTVLLFYQSVEEHAKLFERILSHVTSRVITEELRAVSSLVEQIEEAWAIGGERLPVEGPRPNPDELLVEIILQRIERTREEMSPKKKIGK